MTRTNVNLVRDPLHVTTKLTQSSYEPAPAPIGRTPTAARVMVHGRYIRAGEGPGEVVVAVDAGALKRKMAVIAATEDSNVSTVTAKDSFFSSLSR